MRAVTRTGAGESKASSEGGPSGADVPTWASRRTDGRLLAVLTGLTFVTGIVDAITYLDLGHVFAANMTGNVVLMGFAMVGADQISVSASVVSLGAFLVGAALGGRITRHIDRRVHARIVTSLVMESGLLATAMFAALYRASVGDNVNSVTANPAVRTFQEG